MTSSSTPTCPATAEALLHRSGRTGRAGRKGLAILIVPPALRRRAEALVARAGLALDWRPLPGREDIHLSDHARMLEDPLLGTPPSEPEQARIAALLGAHGAEQVAAAFLRLWTGGRPSPDDVPARNGEPGAAPRPNHGADGGIWFSLDRGGDGQAEVRSIRPLICRLGRVNKRDIGRIRVLEGETQFEIKRSAARGFAAAAARNVHEGATIRRLDGPPAPVAPGSRPRLNRPIPSCPMRNRPHARPALTHNTLVEAA